MKADRVVACFGQNAGQRLKFTVELRQVPDCRAGDPLLLGVIQGNASTDATTLVRSCEYHPLKAAWMAGSYVVGDGTLHMITPVDPLLFLIPSFPCAPGQTFGELSFCDLEQLFESHVSPACQFIQRAIDPTQLANLCDIKAVDEDSYYRFSFARIVAWLQCKAEQTLHALQTHCPQSLTHDAESDLLYAATMVTEHLSSEWESHLIQSLGLCACSTRPQKRPATQHKPTSPQKQPKGEKTAVLSTQQKAKLSREASKAAAFSKVAQGSAKIASFFKKR
eukprot:jgi/Ulvmu1/7817/UM004_0046.1